MEEIHRFRVVAWWASGRTGLAKSNSAPNAIHFTSPPAFGGLDGRWTPEDLLLGAIASCYTTTFRALAENSKFEYTDLQVEVESAIGKADRGYSLREVLIRARLMVSARRGRGPGSQTFAEGKGVMSGLAGALDRNRDLNPMCRSAFHE